MILKKFVLAFVCLNLLGCAIAEQIAKSSHPSGQASDVGSTEAEIVKRFGSPRDVRSLAVNDNIVYYKDRWYRITDDRAVAGELFDETQYIIDVKSYADDDISTAASENTYQIYSGMKDMPNNDVEFKTYARSIRTLMNSFGFKQVDKNPRYVVVFSYGISDPIVDIDVTYTPTYTWVPGQSVTSSGYVGNTSYSSTSYSSGYLANSGYVPKVTKSTNFKRYVVLNILKNGPNLSETPHLWKFVAQSTGSSDDLQTVVGVMVGQSYPYFMKATGKKLTIGRPRNDPMGFIPFQ